MSKNFSAPRSKPKPASVTAQSARCMAVRVARMLLQPWAMLAKGPPWMRAGTPSRVWTKLGCRASRSRASMAPVTFSSLARTGSPSKEKPTRVRSMRSRRSSGFSARQSMAMTSEAAVMSKPPSRGIPWARPPRPKTTCRRERSFMSMTRRQRTLRGSSLGLCPK